MRMFRIASGIYQQIKKSIKFPLSEFLTTPLIHSFASIKIEPKP